MVAAEPSPSATGDMWTPGAAPPTPEEAQASAEHGDPHRRDEGMRRRQPENGVPQPEPETVGPGGGHSPVHQDCGGTWTLEGCAWWRGTQVTWGAVPALGPQASHLPWLAVLRGSWLWSWVSAK